MIETEVLIIGGGPAGTACARGLKQHQVDCMILDKADFPRNKPCAGWVTPEVFRMLEINPGDYPFGLTNFTSFKVSLRGVKFRLPTYQHAIRRVEFDAWLHKRAEVECLHHKVKTIEVIDGRYLIDGQFSARYLVGAGGTHCPVRRSLFDKGQPPLKNGLIIAKEEEFLYPFSDDRCHLWFFEKGLPGYAWYVPKSGGYLNVGIGGSAAGLQSRGETLNKHWKRLLEKLGQAGLVTGHDFKPQGYSYYLRQKSPQTRWGNAFLVGDALGLATKDMGEGIGPAIHSGLLTADAISKGQDYAVNTIPLYSFPSLLRLRR